VDGLRGYSSIRHVFLEKRFTARGLPRELLSVCAIGNSTAVRRSLGVFSQCGDICQEAMMCVSHYTQL